MIELEVTRSSINFPRNMQARVAHALARRTLQEDVRNELDALTTAGDSFRTSLSTTTLDWMMTKYSEQLVFNPRREIEHWFAYDSGAYLDPGYPPLFYQADRRKGPSPNKSAVAAIGEGVAGFLAQRVYGCRKLARPNHDCPDIVMEANNTTYLVEAKASLGGNAADAISENKLSFVSLTATSAILDVRPVRGLLVSTSIALEDSYRIHILEVNAVS
ncbi:hypothetical protein Mal4_40620 [Maioricimonas rarisocia]|uniref:Uncharacterized protein n=1 Tax=Maioricimonas rarisocia TaxID=2528026 RepID=A0A517ZB42_9PLAN|nr:hypothetical protein [Maioricimonas rarisocia]QDU39716.1 hypothetical protein Mal4_40620 [Maioricimonas rarisocia]